MGEVRLSWTGERLQFVAETGYGEAVSVGGDPEGPGAKPADLLPVSLAACTAYDVVEILRKQRQDLRGLEAIVRSQQDPDPPWTFRAIDVEWVLTGDVDPNEGGARGLAGRRKVLRRGGDAPSGRRADAFHPDRAGLGLRSPMDGASFRSLLAQGPLLADGGMGTALIDAGVPVDACMEALNEREPDRVAGVHGAFVAAGARLVLTNTFGANRFRLDHHGLADRVSGAVRRRGRDGPRRPAPSWSAARWARWACASSPTAGCRPRRRSRPTGSRRLRSPPPASTSS